MLTEKEHLWQSRKPSKRALQLAFYTGEVTMSERTGMLKTYELMTRHFGWDRPPKPASSTETTAYLLDRALRSQGMVSLDSICHLDAPSKAAVRRLIEARVRRKVSSCRSRSKVPASWSMGAGRKCWTQPPEVTRPGAHPVAVRSADHPAQAHGTVLRLRSPFRSLCAEGKAHVGYFALPVLVGNDIVAAIDSRPTARTGNC